MRPIKFRGRRLDNQEWVYGDYFKTPLTAEVAVNPECGCFFLTGEKRHCISSEGVAFPVDPETVGQFTGLFDKNGTEIYEGDIVKFRTKRYWGRNGQIDHHAAVSRYKWFVSPVLYSEGDCLVNESNKLTHPLDADSYDSSLACWAFKQNPEIDKHNDSRLHIIGNIHDNPELLKTK